MAGCLPACSRESPALTTNQLIALAAAAATGLATPRSDDYCLALTGGLARSLTLTLAAWLDRWIAAV